MWPATFALAVYNLHTIRLMVDNQCHGCLQFSGSMTHKTVVQPCLLAMLYIVYCAMQTHDLSQEGLAVVLTHAVKDLIAAASNQQMLSSAVTQLQILAQVPVTAQLLERTGIAKSIKQLRKHDNADVGTAAAATIEAWRKRLMSE